MVEGASLNPLFSSINLNRSRISLEIQLQGEVVIRLAIKETFMGLFGHDSPNRVSKCSQSRGPTVRSSENICRAHGTSIYDFMFMLMFMLMFMSNHCPRTRQSPSN